MSNCDEDDDEDNEDDKNYEDDEDDLILLIHSIHCLFLRRPSEDGGMTRDCFTNQSNVDRRSIYRPSEKVIENEHR